MIVWIIGLSGSGKTTLGRALAHQWQMTAPNTVLLDGDTLRALFAFDHTEMAYTLAGRRTNAERMLALCELFDRQNINVVCCLLSIFPQMRLENRKRFDRYFEIFMDAPLEILKQRDPKGLYAKAARGEEKNVVGIDIPFDRPVGSDMRIDTSGDTPDLAALVEEILHRLHACQKAQMTPEMPYPYAQGDLLEERQSYFYTPYEGSSFLQAWRLSRDAVQKHTQRPLLSRPKSPSSPTYVLLATLQKALATKCPTHKTWQDLNCLVQRFEVSKRLHSAYNEQWRPVASSDYKTLELYVLFAEVLHLAYASSSVLSYLNALLKVIDTLCSVREKLDAAQAHRLSLLITVEADHVASLFAGALMKPKATHLASYSMVLSHADFWQALLHHTLGIQYRLRSYLFEQSQHWPAEQRYTQGYFYQGLEELGICGAKPTAYRFSQYAVDPLLTDQTILDIGSNCGFVACHCAKRARFVTALELNPYLNKIARESAAFLGRKNVEVIEADFANWHTSDQFDVVLSLSNHHTIDGNLHMGFSRYIEKIASLVKLGGYLLFESHDVFGLGQGGPGDDGDMAEKMSMINRYFTITRHHMVRCYLKDDIDKLFIVAQRTDTPFPVVFDLLKARRSYEYPPITQDVLGGSL